MSQAVVDPDGTVRRNERAGASAEIMTSQDAEVPSLVARFVNQLATALAALAARWHPRSVDFADVVVGTAGASVSLTHGFGAKARWWVVGQSSGTAGTVLVESSASTTDTLVLLSYVPATVTIRVEEAGA